MEACPEGRDRWLHAHAWPSIGCVGTLPLRRDHCVGASSTRRSGKAIALGSLSRPGRGKGPAAKRWEG
ncbi:hypothetical protein [Azospirillum endophyticum]